MIALVPGFAYFGILAAAGLAVCAFFTKRERRGDG